MNRKVDKCKTDIQKNRQTEKQNDRLANTDGRTFVQANRPIDRRRHIDRQVDRQAYKQTDKETDK